jgi:hypothetical protein
MAQGQAGQAGKRGWAYGAALSATFAAALGFGTVRAEAAPKRSAQRSAAKPSPKNEPSMATEASEAASGDKSTATGGNWGIAAPATPAGSTSETPPSATAPAATTPDGRPVDPELGAPPTTTDTDPKLRPSPLTPRPEEMPTRDGTAPDYAALLGELVALRARVTALTAALYESKLRVTLETDDDEARYSSLVVTIDGGVVYTAPERFVGTEEQIVFEHSVAPGPHVIGVETERYDGRAPTFRSWQVTRYSVDVPEKKLLAAHVMLEDDSKMGDFSSDGAGRYELGARLDVEVIEP